MQAAVEFQDERLEVDVPEGRLLGVWHGPKGMPALELPRFLDDVLEHPRDFPALRLAIVPGDHVVIALGKDVPDASAVLAAVWRVLEAAGVEAEGLTVLTTAPASAELISALPRATAFETHDPDDRTKLAYLSATASGRRIYLNRVLTDADFVLPVGRLAHDAVRGAQGPWSAIFPGFSDTESLRAENTSTAGTPQESIEVSWLLGSQFQLGVIAGATGLVGALSGLAEKVADDGMQLFNEMWMFQSETRADLVLAGVSQATGIDVVARALANALDLVRHGGKIVVLSRAGGPLGPAMRRLIAAGDRRAASRVLKGREADEDIATARLFAKAVEWADVYLLSAFSQDDMDGLSIVPLDRPEEARRLVAVCESCLLMSHAELVHASVVDELS